MCGCLIVSGFGTLPTLNLCPGIQTFHEDLNYFIHVKTQLVHILAYILVQCPAPWAMCPWLRLGPAHSWHRSLPYASLPLHAAGDNVGLITALGTPHPTPLPSPRAVPSISPHLPCHSLVRHIEKFRIML